MGFLRLNEIPDLKEGVLDLSTIDIVEINESTCGILLYNNRRELGEFCLVLHLGSNLQAEGFFVDRKIEGLSSSLAKGSHYIAYGPVGHLFEYENGVAREDFSIVDMGWTMEFGELTRAVCIRDEFYLMGMARQIYLRAKGSWVLLSPDIIDRSVERFSFSGFFCADGDGEEILCAGVGGEVWKSHKGIWEKLDSPYNLDIHDICCIGKNSFVLGGQQGVIGICVEDRWYDLTEAVALSDIQRVVAFGGFVFVLSEGKVIRMAISSDYSVKEVAKVDVA